MRVDSRMRTTRPSIPPLLFGGIVFWVVVAALYIPLMSLDASTLAVVCWLSVALVAVLLIVFWRNKKSYILLVSLFAVAGVVVVGTGAGEYLTKCEKALSESSHEYIFEISEDPVILSLGTSYYATTKLLSGETIKVKLYINEEVNLSYGDSISSHTSFRGPSDKSKETYQKKNVSAVANIDSFMILERGASPFSLVMFIRSYAQDVLDKYTSDSDVILKALLIGDRGRLYQTDSYQEVKACGLAHLVAVSGAHLVIISSFVAFLLNKTALSKRTKVFLHVLILVFYLFFVGFPVSCLRAVVMSFLSFCAPLMMRRSSALSSLGVIIVLFIGFDPSTALSLSFSLSLLATLGIVLFMPLFSSLLPSSRKFQCVVYLIVMTLAATLLTFPITTSVFSQFSLVAPFANVVAAPFLTVLCTGGIIALVLSFVPVVGPFLVLMIRSISRLFCFVVHGLSQVPFACIPVSLDLVIAYCAVFVLCAVFWIFWARISLKCILIPSCLGILVLSGIVFLHPASTEIVMLDVGQGDAFLLKSEKKTMLVDTGNQPSKLLAGLAQNGVVSLDAVLITHPDDDHCGALESLKGVVGIDKIIVANGTLASKEDNPKELCAVSQKLVSKENIVELGAGNTIAFGEFRLSILSPEVITEGGNEDSLCFLLTSTFSQADGKPFTALFVGDAEKDIEQNLAQQYHLTNIDLYKVSHHGSKNALTEELSRTLNPEIALISVGAHNSYGHPNSQTLSLLEQSGCTIFRTDIDGEVVCRITPENVSVTATMK